MKKIKTLAFLSLILGFCVPSFAAPVELKFSVNAKAGCTLEASDYHMDLESKMYEAASVIGSGYFEYRCSKKTAIRIYAIGSNYSKLDSSLTYPDANVLTLQTETPNSTNSFLYSVSMNGKSIFTNPSAVNHSYVAPANTVRLPTTVTIFGLKALQNPDKRVKIHTYRPGVYKDNLTYYISF